tara:strand:+ start:508 stop:660 length:153 start_codon:yes stop_codon:yes gene_type:complete
VDQEGVETEDKATQVLELTQLSILVQVVVVQVQIQPCLALVVQASLLFVT